MLPRGKPLHALIDENATVEAIEGDPEQAVALMIPGSVPLRIELVPGRDWLARRTMLGIPTWPRFAVYEATKFAQSNGRWFPIEGASVAKGGPPGRLPRWKFEVREFAVNKPIDPRRFAKPAVTEGVEVRHDFKKAEPIIGGEKAQMRLTLRYLNAHPDAFPQSQVDSIRAHAAKQGVVEEPPRIWILPAIGLGVVLFAVVAVIASSMMLRRRRNAIPAPTAD